MPKHDITITLPTKPIKNVDTSIAIRSGRKLLGTMLISKGSLDWYRAGVQKPRRVTWEDLEYLLNNVSRALKALRKQDAAKS